ncbi:MAG: DUF4405 domain-containing protein [Planctomycetia bacterium]|nr:DUF4405 domain-containing protein [Planctomycetia bacterium]
MKRFPLDGILLMLLVAVALHKLTGDAIHEWVSLVFAAFLIGHLLVNWDLIFGVGKRLFAKGPSASARFNFVWNLLLYTAMGVVMLSGILISRSVLPSLGIALENDPFMSYIHKRSIFVLYAMLGVHFGMHWDWIRSHFARKKEVAE